MAIELATQFKPYVDEQFTTESKTELVTNKDFTWTGAHTIKVYKISTGTMNDYDRDGTGTGATGSRYGVIESLNATTEEFTLKKDRSFTFAIDKLDKDETVQQLQSATALSRQNREIIIPEVDSYVYGVMCDGAGTKENAVELDEMNIYDQIIKATNVLDNAEVPEEDRILIVTPDIYRIMKRSSDITMETDVDTNLRKQGIVSHIDGAKVLKVPATRLPANFGFMLCHKCATVAPVKLEDYTIHENPPGINGSLVEGRICYDAFILDNKKMAIYYHEQPQP